jgi:hypothetical protein
VLHIHDTTLALVHSLCPETSLGPNTARALLMIHAIAEPVDAEVNAWKEQLQMQMWLQHT